MKKCAKYEKYNCILLSAIFSHEFPVWLRFFPYFAIVTCYIWRFNFFFHFVAVEMILIFVIIFLVYTHTHIQNMIIITNEYEIKIYGRFSLEREKIVDYHFEYI